MRSFALLLLCAIGVVQAAPAAAIDAASELETRLQSHGSEALIAQSPDFLNASIEQGLCAVFAAATRNDSEAKTVAGLAAADRLQLGAALVAFSLETNS